jgi:hypothetical protein
VVDAADGTWPAFSVASVTENVPPGVRTIVDGVVENVDMIRSGRVTVT